MPYPGAQVNFHISEHPAKISVVEELQGESGWLFLQRLVIDSFEREEYLLFSGFGDNGHHLDQKVCKKLFSCRGSLGAQVEIADDIEKRLKKEARRHAQATISRSLEENSRHFNEARERLEKWGDDLVLASAKELKDTKEQIKVLNRPARLAPTLAEQHQIQERIQELEKKKRRQRQRIFDLEDGIMEKRNGLIAALERRLAQRTTMDPLFTIRWPVV